MFHSARLKLTAWYLVIIFLIILFFSVAVYSLLSREVERFARMQRSRFDRPYTIITPSGERIEMRTPPTDDPYPQLVEETKQRIGIMLAGIDALILLLSGGVAYFLAGKTLSPIKEMMDDQNRFIADASHELRTPLTALKSAMEVHLRDKKLTVSQARSLIGNSVQEVNKLQALSDGMLQLIQYQKPNGHISPKPFSIGDVVTEAVGSFSAIAKERQVHVQVDIEDMTLDGYAHSINDLIRILLDNAIKYSPPGSTITVATQVHDHMMKLTIADEGIGIEEKDLPHIFDRFYRADTARSKQNASGYGLGLSIAKHIVRMHQGTIQVSSIVKKGTTFTIRLPRKLPRRRRAFYGSRFATRS